ncbi:MAG: ABC transporter permease subunit [Candidatus Tectomicrobia bacterium]|uniref:ABC transporter permease subunit n=1 Tax=Tectimicrobiota bacterium TaxID=2528274 RepID=A0A932CQJ2_UNCTE|nr:ABC transporter permease subunit [Candidatus Tectomicrobia bacterium]
MARWTIRGEIPRGLALGLNIAVWMVLLALWMGIVWLRLLPPMSLPHPLDVARAFVSLARDYNLIGNIAVSWWRIFQAFTIAAVVAIPMGILMGSFEAIHAFFFPVIAFMRAMPITAFLPALIGLFGIEEGMKIAFLLIGMIPYLISVVVDECRKVPHEILETAYTLGANRRQILRLLFGASLPAIFEAFIILYDIGWTYVILAEIVNARMGVGAMIEAARKVLDFDRVYAGIFVIGVATFLFRTLLWALYRRLFPYKGR